MVTGSRSLMSARGYAKRRGCSHPLVVRMVAQGRLDPALMRDGKRTLIDAAVADGLWPSRRGDGDAPAAEARPNPRTARGSRGGITRAEADRRRALAAAQLAEIELARVRGESLDAGEVQRHAAQRVRAARAILMSIPSRLALEPLQRAQLREELSRVCVELAALAKPDGGGHGKA